MPLTRGAKADTPENRRKKRTNRAWDQVPERRCVQSSAVKGITSEKNKVVTSINRRHSQNLSVQETMDITEDATATNGRTSANGKKSTPVTDEPKSPKNEANK